MLNVKFHSASLSGEILSSWFRASVYRESVLCYSASYYSEEREGSSVIFYSLSVFLLEWSEFCFD